MKALRAVLILLLVALVGPGTWLTPASAAALPAPSGLHVLSTSTTAISLAWKSSGSEASYLVEFDTDASFKGPKSTTVTAAGADLTGLAKGTVYYVRATAVDEDGKALSKTSTTLKTETRASGYTHLAPLGLKVSKATTTSLSFTWQSRGSGIRYRVSYATKSSFSNAVYDRETSTSLTVSKLQPNTTYYVKVRVITSSGTNLSSYSAAITTKTEALPSPKNLAVTATAKTALAFNWQPVAGTQRYRVQYSTSSKMSNASYVRFTDESAELTGLRSGTVYYLKVRAITSAGVNLSPYSAAVKTSTASSATATYLPPKGLAATAPSSGRLAITWTSRASGLHYQLQYSTKSDLSSPSTLTASTTKAGISGLDAATTYYVRVRALTSGGSVVSGWSQPLAVTTRSTEQPQLTIASYNVKCANCYSALPNEGTWYERRDAVVAAVKAQHPDVIGFQEASQGWLKDANGKAISKSQFEDLVERLGSPYKLTNTHRNNCVKSTTPTNCVYKDQGASQGTKIVYNSTVLTLITQGSKALSKAQATDADRYVAWAIFEHKSTGRRFFFADTHLEYQHDAPGLSTYYSTRVTQTKEALAVIAAKRQGLPAYFVGDFNSHKWSTPDNGPYTVTRSAGFIDPLGNVDRSTTTTDGAIVGKRIKTNFSSYNGYATKAPSFSYTNGTYIDYIWVSAGIEVAEWETVVKVDANNNFIGQIPSDHNMIRATTRLT